MPQDTYEVIVESARRLLENSGPEALGIRQTAKEAGVSTGTVTYYFRSRAALIEVLLEKYHQIISDLQEEFADLATKYPHEPVKAIKAMLPSVYEKCRDNQALITLVSITQLQHGRLPSRFDGMLLRAAETFASFVGTTPAQLSLLIQSVGFSLARYAMMEDKEICKLVGKDPCIDVAEAHQAVVDHLIRLVVSVIAGGGATGPRRLPIDTRDTKLRVKSATVPPSRSSAGRPSAIAGRDAGWRLRYGSAHWLSRPKS